MALVALALGVTMDAVDATVVAVANPSIAVDLGTDLAELQWVSNGYMLATAVFLITAGKLGDRFGHKGVFLLGVAGFVVSSLLVGLSTNVEMMIVFRVVQGACGAALMPTGFAILRFTFSPGKLKVAIGVFTGVFALAMASGPFIGGLIVQLAEWRWVFFLNVVLGGLAIVIGAWAVPRTPREERLLPLDAPGVLLLTVALGALVWGVILVPGYGWAHPYTLGSLAGAVVFGAVFVWRERAAADPVLPLGLLSVRAVSASSVVNLIVSGLMFSVFFFIALYLQQVRGFSPLQVGLGLMPVQVLFAAGSPVGGWLNKRLGARVTVVAGLVLFAVALLGMSRLCVDSSYHALWPFLGCLGLGMALVAPTISEVIVTAAPPSLAGVASGLGQTAAFLGAVLGIATLGSLISARVMTELPERLAAAGVPGPLADQVVDLAGSAAQGVPAVPDGTPPDLAAAIVNAGHGAFVSGLRLATLVGGVLALAAIALALWAKASAPVEAGAPATGGDAVPE
ncbi:MFS transporter [Nonomuraea sp. NPDC055795]